MMRRAFFIASLFGLASLTLHASAGRLRGPWDGVKVAPTDAPYNCPEPPAFSRTLDVQAAWIDKKYSILDPQKEADFQKKVEGPTHLGQFAGLAADAWLGKGSRAAAACVYSLLSAAAKADAWDDKMPTNNAIYMQNWMLSGTALAYLKVRSSSAGTPEQDAQIQQWFHALAARVREYFDNGRKRPGSDAWNNHMYWAGLSVAAEGIADNDADAFLWGLAAYEMGIHAIQPDGSLDAEMGRGQKALHYQLYALGPLIMLAELGEANGLDLYAERDGAIHRLVQFNLAAMKAPSLLEKRAEAKQEAKQPYGGLDIGWAVPYTERFPNADLSAMIAQAANVRFWQWGGAPPNAVLPAAAEKGGEAASNQDINPDIGKKIEAALASEFPAGHVHSFFLGEWCGEGKTELRATIADGGDFFVLNNGQGSLSSGEARGPFVIAALEWGPVLGILSSDRSQIDWSNGTYWARCSSRPATRPVNLTGTWIAMDGSCVVHQEGNLVRFGDSKDCLAAGSVDKNGHLELDALAGKFEGDVTVDGNHINWVDGSYWTRAEVYGLAGELKRK
jgi:poly(beta-D-mannuronate) lyase